MSTKPNGFTLLELMITLSILLVTLPTIYPLLLNIHQKNTSLLFNTTHTSEETYIHHQLRKDLQSLTQLDTLSPNLLKGQTTKGSLTYRLKNNAIRRQLKRHIMYLNNTTQTTSFIPEHIHDTLLKLTLTTRKKTTTLLIHLPLLNTP